MPHPVLNYLKDQLLNKRKPIQKAIQNTYNYWMAMYDFLKEYLAEDEALRLLKETAGEIKENQVKE